MIAASVLHQVVLGLAIGIAASAAGAAVGALAATFEVRRRREVMRRRGR